MLLLYWWIVSRLHGDFIAYAELKNAEQHIGLSFIVKWLMFGLGFAIFITFSFIALRPEKPSEPEKKAGETNQAQSQPKKSSEKPDQNDTVFDSVRSKSSLRSKSDMIIEKYPKKK
ncbi:hypothetical protein [Agarilytica rhodophyticola]|uniref:hypothetical protein n=1 Tax=Agarilytica rhodophyticola TaxID=1737490 RepID=UPI001315307E|nr:hypothetical protein [Agarilytica rhodophyticola]